MKTTTKIYGCKTVDLNDGTELHVHMANNAGRGSNNVTLTRMRKNSVRPQYTRSYGADVIAQTTTSGWRGTVNFSKRVQTELGI